MTPDQDTHRHPVVHYALDKLEDRADSQDKLISQLVEHNGALTREVSKHVKDICSLDFNVGGLDIGHKLNADAIKAHTYQLDRLIEVAKASRAAILAFGAITLMNAGAIIWLALR